MSKPCMDAGFMKIPFWNEKMVVFIESDNYCCPEYISGPNKKASRNAESLF